MDRLVGLTSTLASEINAIEQRKNRYTVRQNTVCGTGETSDV